VPLKAFDGSPVYGDLSVLKRWLDRREKNQAPRSAVFYNTVTMHDGNRFVDNRSRMSSTANFSLRMKGMLSELKTFFGILEKSGRRIIVVMLPEHGAAVRGDKMQISGLREIPSPKITLGPAAIRLIGPGYDIPMNPIRISEQTSYLDLMEVVARIMASNPFGKEGLDLKQASSIKEGTSFVSENAGTVVLRQQDKYLMRQDGSQKWIEYRSTE
jgi:cellulose synthase operon protein YhjU